VCAEAARPPRLDEAHWERYIAAFVSSSFNSLFSRRLFASARGPGAPRVFASARGPGAPRVFTGARGPGAPRVYMRGPLSPVTALAVAGARRAV
jgi:hypothetical protein